MGSESKTGMTETALRGYLVYRDLGTGRTYADACELLGYSRKSKYLFSRWAQKYEWGRLLAEHDHSKLRESLGQREIVREITLQKFIDRSDQAGDRVYSIMMDDRQLPIMDRHGEHAVDEEGNKLYKPLVKASTQLQAAATLLGIAGHVPVKRMEHIDKTSEQIDAAARVIASFTPRQLERIDEMLQDPDDAA